MTVTVARLVSVWRLCQRLNVACRCVPRESASNVNYFLTSVISQVCRRLVRRRPATVVIFLIRSTPSSFCSAREAANACLSAHVRRLPQVVQMIKRPSSWRRKKSRVLWRHSSPAYHQIHLTMVAATWIRQRSRSRCLAVRRTHRSSLLLLISLVCLAAMGRQWRLTVSARHNLDLSHRCHPCADCHLG